MTNSVGSFTVRVLSWLLTGQVGSITNSSMVTLNGFFVSLLILQQDTPGNSKVISQV